jgi:UDP-N-acetylmuramoyl-tripeptide--D-alanyl-D-alanine ligase
MESSVFGLGDLLAWLTRGNAAHPIGHGDAPVPFSTVTMSSLPHGSPPMQPGGLFVAIRGERRDGHDFVSDAFANGAIAALVSRVPENLAEAVSEATVEVLDFTTSPTDARQAFHTAQESLSARRPVLLQVDEPMDALQRCAAWWRTQQRTRVLAITGSVGKTTTKDLLANILALRGSVLRTVGNLNNELGLPFMLLKLAPWHSAAVLEIGISHVGEMATFAAIAAPDVSIVTRVAPAHLEYFGDVDTVEQEKGHLVEALRPEGVAVLNADDSRVARMAQRTRASVLTYGLANQAAVQATEVKMNGLTGITFRLHFQGEVRPVSVPLVGQHFAVCALAAAAAAFAEGCDWDQVVAGLSHPVQSRRVEPRPLPNGAWVLDDTYNASPAAMQAALDILATCPGRRIAVLGDMLEFGDAAPALHRQVGAYAACRTDYLVTVGELARQIADGAQASGLGPDRIEVCSSNAAAAAYLTSRLRAEDFVLVKGSRGMRMDEIVYSLTGETSRTHSYH